MKYLTDYIENKQSKLFEDAGAFWAFSNSQFDEKRVEGVKYVVLPHGLICPKPNVDKLIDGIAQINKDAIKEDLDDNGKSKIITRELYNLECFLTWDYDEVIERLKPYGITKEEIQVVFMKEASKQE